MRRRAQAGGAAQRQATLLVAVLCVARAAAAHQAPSPDVNNRYVKLTLLPDRARVSFTLLYGERPGAAERAAMDGDRDGTLSAAEARAFGERALAAFAPRVTVGGAPAAGWRLADVGLGGAATRGGTFALDLVLDAPYPDPRAAEQVITVDDAAAVPLAGEVELRVAESPGVTIAESHLVAASAGLELIYTFAGNASAPGERKVVVRAVVDEALRPRSSRPWLPLAALAALALAAALWWRWRNQPTSS
jgi:hypothetical protein